MEHTGACIYCGQLKIIRGGDKMTDDQINRAATLECDCEQAQTERKAEKKKTFATANIKKLFTEDGEQMVNTLTGLVDALAWRRLDKVSVVNAEGIKAVLTAKENSIRVERIVTTKATLED